MVKTVGSDGILIQKEKNNMSDIPGMNIFDSHEIRNKVDNSAELVITTVAGIDTNDLNVLIDAGWVQRDTHTMAYRKPKVDFKEVALDSLVTPPPDPVPTFKLRGKKKKQ